MMLPVKVAYECRYRVISHIGETEVARVELAYTAADARTQFEVFAHAAPQGNGKLTGASILLLSMRTLGLDRRSSPEFFDPPSDDGYTYR